MGLGNTKFKKGTDTLAAAGIGFWLIPWCVQIDPLKSPFAGICRLHRNYALTLMQRRINKHFKTAYDAFRDRHMSCAWYCCFHFCGAFQQIHSCVALFQTCWNLLSIGELEISGGGFLMVVRCAIPLICKDVYNSSLDLGRHGLQNCGTITHLSPMWRKTLAQAQFMIDVEVNRYGSVTTIHV